jgi:hypothetical protein
MYEPCPHCGSTQTRPGRRSRLYYTRHGPVIAPGCLALIVLALGCTLLAVGEWLLPSFRRELFLLGALAVLAPLALPFQYLGYRRAFSVRQRCLTCGHRWRMVIS